jgi:hypothetical protein
MDELRGLEEWYHSQRDGDWEHEFGVRIETLDNPGWSVEIDLAETELEGADYAEVKVFGPDREWVRTWVEEAKFHGVGGPPMLAAILRQFLEWAATVRRTAV